MNNLCRIWLLFCFLEEEEEKRPLSQEISRGQGLNNGGICIRYREQRDYLCVCVWMETEVKMEIEMDFSRWGRNGFSLPGE